MIRPPTETGVMMLIQSPILFGTLVSTIVIVLLPLVVEKFTALFVVDVSGVMSSGKPPIST